MSSIQERPNGHHPTKNIEKQKGGVYLALEESDVSSTFGGGQGRMFVLQNFVNREISDRKHCKTRCPRGLPNERIIFCNDDERFRANVRNVKLTGSAFAISFQRRKSKRLVCDDLFKIKNGATAIHIFEMNFVRFIAFVMFISKKSKPEIQKTI